MITNHTATPVCSGDKTSQNGGFWNSERAKAIVREHVVPEWAAALGAPARWNPASGEEVWEALSREVRSLRGPEPALNIHGSNIDLSVLDIDGRFRRRRAARCRLGLETFARLLRRWRAEVVESHGANFWEQIITALHDPKEMVVVKLIQQLSARTIRDAVDDLDDLGRTGLRYRLATGLRRAHPLPDCGIGIIVEAARRVENRLQQLERDEPQPTRQNHPAPAAPAEPTRPEPRVRVKGEFVGGGLVLRCLRGNELTGPEFPPPGNQLALLLVLGSSEYGKLSSNWDEFIWDQIWGAHRKDGKPPESYARSVKRNRKDDGVHANIRRLVCDLVGKLRKYFGSAPVGRWVTRVSMASAHGRTISAYRLNEHVHWQILPLDKMSDEPSAHPRRLNSLEAPDNKREDESPDAAA
jgi:hypothetical protein